MIPSQPAPATQSKTPLSQEGRVPQAVAWLVSVMAIPQDDDIHRHCYPTGPSGTHLRAMPSSFRIAHNRKPAAPASHPRCSTTSATPYTPCTPTAKLSLSRSNKKTPPAHPSIACFPSNAARLLIPASLPQPSSHSRL
ncbi:hypothetical protein VTJ04DRAFT_9988 [Mycothermus thermophilus]|uniref:uncharacterized protein n=1 Tax=Humicola insolens TaxID=85995 RepID=UPI0037446F85